MGFDWSRELNLKPFKVVLASMVYCLPLCPQISLRQLICAFSLSALWVGAKFKMTQISAISHDQNLKRETRQTVSARLKQILRTEILVLCISKEFIS